MKYSFNIDVNSHGEDANGIIRPSVVLAYLQEAANRQTKEFGPTYEELLQDGKIFVVSRFALDFKEPIRKFEHLVSESWAAESRGVTFNRYHRLWRDGKVVAEAESVWALIGVSDHKIHRVDEYRPNYACDETIAIDAPVRVVVPANEQLQHLGEYTVSYADVDINRHFNNTRYADFLCGAMDLDGRRVRRMVLNYRAEAPLRERLSLYGKEDPKNTYLFRSMRADGKTNLEAYIETVEIQ